MILQTSTRKSSSFQTCLYHVSGSPFAAILVNCAPSGETHNYCTPLNIKENSENFLIHRCNYILLSQVYCLWQVVKTPTIIFINPVFVCLVLWMYETSVYKLCVTLMCNYWSHCFNDSMRSAPVNGKLMEYFRFACTIARKRDERALQISVKPWNIRHVQTCERCEWVMRLVLFG